jgi:hypothetical protein
MIPFRRLLACGLAIIIISTLTACPKPTQPTQTSGTSSVVNGEQVQLGRLMFDTPTPVSQPGMVDIPRIASVRNGTTHLVFLQSDAGSQRVMYSSMDNGEFKAPSFLSQDEGTKQGGAFIASRNESEFIAYWVNVPASGGQLLYKESDDGGTTFSMEQQWNNRGEVRWPCALATGPDITSYFFVRTQNTWELVANKNFSTESEPTIDTVRGNPFTLRGATDGSSKTWLTYFERVERSEGGRIAFLTSTDSGATFTRRYLFEDRVINNTFNFIRLARTVSGRDEILHLIFIEDTPDVSTLYYSRSVAGGEFSAPIAVFTSEEPLTHSPDLCAEGSRVVVVTADTDEIGPAMRYVYSQDGGASFDQPAVATRDISNPETVSGAIDQNGNVLLVWDDLSKQGEGVEQIYRLKGSLRGE